MPDKYTQLLDYVKTNGRICPQPPQWNRLCNLLPGPQDVAAGWPGEPLILAAWWEYGQSDKQERFLAHLEWAQAHGGLDAADAYLRALPEKQWHHGRD